MKVATSCLLARDFENLLELKVPLIERWNVPAFQLPVFSIFLVCLSLAERLLKKTTKLDGNDTTLSHHPYILCHSSCQLCTPLNSLHACSQPIHMH